VTALDVVALGAGADVAFELGRQLVVLIDHQIKPWSGFFLTELVYDGPQASGGVSSIGQMMRTSTRFAGAAFSSPGMRSPDARDVQSGQPHRAGL
jgi:hypothetical protein